MVPYNNPTFTPVWETVLPPFWETGSRLREAEHFAWQYTTYKERIQILKNPSDFMFVNRLEQPILTPPAHTPDGVPPGAGHTSSLGGNEGGCVYIQTAIREH